MPIKEWPYEHFTREECEEACETPEQLFSVSPQLLFALDDFREELKSAITFSPVKGALFATKGHSKNSYHYKGQAADIMFPKMPLLEAFFTATRFVLFNGIGVYPFWKPDPGLHVDIRPGKMRAYWWRDEENRYYWLHNEKEIRQLFEKLIPAK